MLKRVTVVYGPRVRLAKRSYKTNLAHQKSLPNFKPQLADSGASFRSCQRPHCSENKHSTWRQEFLGRGNENLEQSTRLNAAAWHWIWTLWTTFKGISTWRSCGAL